METTMTAGFVLIGLGVVAAGVVGIGLPSGERLSAALPLVVGAGVGVIALAIGAQVVNADPEQAERVFLVASALGFSATAASLVWLWRRAARARPGRPGATDLGGAGYAAGSCMKSPHSHSE